MQAVNDVPWTGTQIMDMAFGPDGALYVLDYGLSWFGGDENSALYRIENATDGHSPVAQAAADRTSGQAPLKVSFSSAGTTDADVSAWIVHLDGSRTEVAWDRAAWPYLAQAGWDDHGPFVALHPRDQGAIEVRAVDPLTGATTLLWEDHD